MGFVWLSGLDGKLGLCASAASVSCVCVTREFYSVVVLELERLLEPLANLLESLFALLCSSAFTLLTRRCATHGSCPETNSVEATPDIDHDAHDLVVFFILEILANGCKHYVEPERVDVDCLLVLELECPLATMLVLRVFPLRSNALLEEMVVGLERKIRCWRDVVLDSSQSLIVSRKSA